MLALGLAGTAGASTGAAVVPVAGSVAPFAARGGAIGQLASSRQLTIDVWLKPKLAAAAWLASQASTPGSALFRRYLTPAAYTARFGPTRSQAAAVTSWLRGAGFTAISTDQQRSYIRATASVAVIDAAFRTQLSRYPDTARASAGPYQLRANSEPVWLPAGLAASILGVTGLDNAAVVARGTLAAGGPATSARGITPHAASGTPACSQYYGQHQVTGQPPLLRATSFPTPVCGYTASQIRAVYGANWASTGNGQTIALVEPGLVRDMFGTLQDYAKANHMPAPSAARYTQLSLSKPNSCLFFTSEQQDVEASYDMAPGAHQLVVAGDPCDNGDFGSQAVIDADTAILDGHHNRPLASIVANTWASGDEEQPAELTDIEHAFLIRAAAEGVGMYVLSGDFGGQSEPSIDPYATAVGGTTLGIGKTGSRLFETGMSDASYLATQGQWVVQGLAAASGGGPSLLWREPGYQKPVVPPAMSGGPSGNRSGGPSRVAPDISADADPLTSIAVGQLTNSGGKASYSEAPGGGTALATVLVAGMVAAAQQGQHKPFGFLNPVLYKLAGTSAFRDVLPLTPQSPALDQAVYCGAAQCGFAQLIAFDSQLPMLGYLDQVTAPGYDTMTGIGTPNGQSFIAALRKLAR